MSEPKQPKTVPVFNNDGELLGVPEDQYESAMKYGGIRPASKAEVDDYLARQKAASQPIRAFAEGAARSATFGGSDYIAQSLGVPQEELRLRREENPHAAPAGEIAMDIATAFLPGGAITKAAKFAKEGKVAKAALEGLGAATSVGRVPISAGEAVAHTIARAGTGSTRGIAKAITSKLGQRVAGEAVEGALYGARQAVTEDALGNTDLTAESLLTNAGLGALVGGATGGTLNVLGAGMKSLGKTGAAATKKFLNIGADEGFEQAANKEAYAALKPTKKDIKLSTDASRQEHGRWLHEKGLTGKFKTVDDVASGAERIAEETAPKIEQAYKQLDEMAPAKLDAAGIYKRIDDEVIAPLRNDPFLREYAARVEAKLQGFKDDFLPDATGVARKELGYTDLWNLRKSLDSNINFNKDPNDIAVNSYLRDVRNVFRNALETPPINTPQAKAIIGDLKALNKDYSLAMKTADMANNVLDSQAASQSKLGMFDRMSGITGATIGASFGGPLIGAAAGAISAYGNKVLKERGAMFTASVLDDIAKLGQLEKTQNQTLVQIKNAVSGLFDGAKKAATPTTVDTTFGFLRAGSEKKKGESRRDAAIRRIDEVRDLIGDSEHLTTALADRTKHLQEVAPNTAASLQQTIIRAAEYLNQNLPKDPHLGNSITPLVPTKWQPTGAEIAKAMRQIRAVENPKVVLDDIRNGKVSLDSMEALKAVYPNLHAQIVEAIFEKAADHKKPLSYQQKVQLSIITGTPVDPTLEPKMLRKLQENFKMPKAQAPKGGSNGKAGIPSLSQSLMTQGQRLGVR